MTTVLTYGTFDLFHYGHVRLLERARNMGDRLGVGVSSDAFNDVKGKRCVMPFEHRAAIVKALSCVDFVFPETGWEQKRQDIRTYKADILVMGDDWRSKFDHLSDLCRVEYLERTDGISTTEIKTALAAFNGERIRELHRGIEMLHDIARQLR